MKTRVQNFAAGLTTAVVVGAVLAGPSWAVRPDDRAGMLGVGAISAQTRESLRPDDRGTARGPGSVSIVALEYKASISAQGESATRPDDRAETRGPGSIDAPATSVATTDGDGFPWSEMGMGAALFAVVGLLGAALVVNGRYNSRPA